MEKYYTPDISDLFVGYECEILRKDMWISDTIIIDPMMDSSWVLLHEGKLRTPYLTKEQIEKEGWKDITNPLNINVWAFEKGNRFTMVKINDLKNPFILNIIIKDPSKEELIFNTPSEHYRCIIPCPSINEFRKICKLLGI